jgi:hypothetical protein
MSLLVGVIAAAPPNPTTSARGAPQAAPAAPNPEAVLWDQYSGGFTGVNFAAQDFEVAYDMYDIWAADDFENLVDWEVGTIVNRGGWTGYVDLNNATELHWYICGDAGGMPSCYPGDGTEYWSIHLPPSDPQVALGVVEPEDIYLNLAAPVVLPPGHWWLVFQASLEFGLYGQYGWSGTLDPVWGDLPRQWNPGEGFGMGPDWFLTGYAEDLQFRLEGEELGGDPKVFVQMIFMRVIEPQPDVFIVQGIVRIMDEDMNPVPNATVAAEWQRPMGPPIPQTRTTRPNGIAVFMMRAVPQGVYELCITNVQAAGYQYDPGMNWETCDSIVYP